MINQLKDGNRKLETCFGYYIEECEYSKRLRPKTIKGYKEVFKNFTQRMPEISTIDDLSAPIVNTFFKRITVRMRAQNKELKNSTLRTYYNKLIVFFRWLEQKQLLEDGDLTKSIVKPASPVYDDERALKENDISQILSTITLHSTHSPFLYKRDILIVSILLYTGIRKGELLGLRVQDVDLANRSLFVNGQTSKSKKSRKIPINPTLALHFKSYLQEEKRQTSNCATLVLSYNQDKPLTEHGLKHWVHRYRQLSGVPFFIHRFRHTFACTMAKNNADIISIKNVLGHSSLRMTERYLRSINSENARKFIDTLEY